jgi:uncharacterized membrane protein
MSTTVPATRYNRLTLMNLAANLGFLCLFLIPLVVADRARLSAAIATAHAPSVRVILGAPPLVILHLTAVVIALVLGAILLCVRKGVRLHRILGWSWVVAMLIAAVTSVFLRGIKTGAFSTGGFSFFHVITAIVLLLLPLAVLAARKQYIRWHAAIMIYLLINVLLSAGLLAMYPGFSERLLPIAIFGE